MYIFGIAKKLYAVKCNLAELTTKTTSIPLHSTVFWHAHAYARIPYVLRVRHVFSAYSECCFVWEHILKAVPPPPPPTFPSLFFHCSLSVTGAYPPFCIVDNGWIASICQLWEQSSSRSWLSIVDAPGCHRHPTSIL